jgi:RHS repeat-associated protein
LDLTQFFCYDYGFRFYDPALGRFPSLDPKADAFPHVSPYNYAENRPIDGIDLWGLQWAPAPYKTSSAINSVKSIKVNSQSQALGRRMFSDAAMIGGGVVLTVASAGTASAILPALGGTANFSGISLASGSLLAGTYGMAGGTAKLTLDIAGRASDADKVPNTISGGIVGKTIDFARGGEDQIAEKGMDVLQNILTRPFGNDILSFSFGSEQLIESGVELHNEIDKKTSSDNSAEENINQTETSPENYEVPFYLRRVEEE